MNLDRFLQGHDIELKTAEDYVKNFNQHAKNSTPNWIKLPTKDIEAQ